MGSVFPVMPDPDPASSFSTPCKFSGFRVKPGMTKRGTATFLALRHSLFAAMAIHGKPWGIQPQGIKRTVSPPLAGGDQGEGDKIALEIPPSPPPKGRVIKRVDNLHV
jgi:hypothetical protein